MKRGWVLVLVFLGVLAAFVAATIAAGGPLMHAPPRWDAGSSNFAIFGLIAVAGLWVISAAFAGQWNPVVLAMGKDGRLSTSKMQALLWTATVAYAYVTVYADRVVTQSAPQAMTSVPDNVLLLMGISATTAVAAKAITTSQVAASGGAAKSSVTPTFNPSALLCEDDSATPSLTKAQMLFWTVVAVVAYVVTTMSQLGTLATCVPTADHACGLPDVDTVLMIFMGFGSATYLGAKVTNAPAPSLQSATTAVDASGTRIVTLQGSNLGASGTLAMNGATFAPASLGWSASAISFPMPPRSDGAAWKTGDSALFTVTLPSGKSASLSTVLA